MFAAPSAAAGTGAACGERGGGGGGGRGGQGGSAGELHDELLCSLTDLIPESALIMLVTESALRWDVCHNTRALPDVTLAEVSIRSRPPVGRRPPTDLRCRPPVLKSPQRGSRRITRSSPATSMSRPPRRTRADSRPWLSAITQSPRRISSTSSGNGARTM